MTRRLFLAVILASITWAIPAAAQTLQLKVSTFQSRARSQAPVPLEMLLSWDGIKIIEGHLELAFDDQQMNSDGGLKPIAHYRSPELALATGDRRMRMLVPPQRITNLNGAMGVKAQFVVSKDNSVIDLGTHMVVTPRPGTRRIRIGVVLPESQIAVAESQLPFIRALSLEQFRRQADIREDSVQGSLVTQGVRVQSRDLPRTAIEFCAFDLIVLTRDGLGEVPETSLDSLTRWVRAGGRTLIDMGGRHDDSTTTFLNQLLTDDGPEKPVLLQPDGSATLSNTDGEDLDNAYRQAGLGRVCVTTRDLSQDIPFDTAGWRSLVAWLWEVNDVQQRRVRNSPGTWQENPAPFDRVRMIEQPTPFEPADFNEERELTTLLLPESVQSIPPWHVISMLFVFLLLIAPGDYMLLGLIKRRTLTWILFPTVSLIVTLYTVRLAETTVGSLDFTTSLTIVDMTDDETVARSSRLEMLFTAAERDAVSDEKEVIFTPLVDDAKAIFEDGMAYGSQQPSQSQSDFQFNVEHEPPQFEGLMPRSFTIVRRMRKWTPQLSRRTWIGPPPGELPEFDWSLIDQDLLTNVDGRREIIRAVAEAAPEAHVVIAGNIATIESGADGEAQTSQPIGSQAIRNAGRLATFSALTRKYSIPQTPYGWAAVMTRVSPTGAANLEDLWMLDRSNPYEVLVIVTFREDDNFTSLRRMYRFGQPTGPKVTESN